MAFSALRIKNSLEKKEYKNIIGNNDRFTELFCMVFMELEIGDDIFNISLDDDTNTFEFDGKNRVIDEIFIFVDKIRKILVKNLNNTNIVSISFIEMAKTIYIKQTNEIIDLSNWQFTRKNIPWIFFNSYIKRCIPLLFEKIININNRKIY